MIGSVTIDRVTHNALFAEAKGLIDMAGTVIVYEDVQKEPVRAIFAKYSVCYLGEKFSAQALIGNADCQTFEFYCSMFRT